MAGANARISCSEKLANVSEKLGNAVRVARGMLPGGRFQLGSAEVRGNTYKVFKNLPPAVGDHCRAFFLEHGEKPWLHYEEETISFQQALKTYEALAAELVTSFACGRGDSVGICMRNLPEFLMGFLGAVAAGCRAVPLNALWGTKELQYAIGDSECKVLLCDPVRLALCLPFAADLGFHIVLCRGLDPDAEAVGATLWEDVIMRGLSKPRPALTDIQPEDDAMIMYTSGSTGGPKGVVHTQRSLGTAMKIGELSAVASEPNSKAILALPLFHITSLMNVFLHSLPAGIQLVMLRNWDAGKCLELIEKLQVTRFVCVPTMIRDMLEHPSFAPERVASMKQFAAGGAPVPPAQVERMRKVTKSASSAQGYGLTETCGGVIVNRGIDYLKHPTSCGKPIPLVVEVAILDPATNELVAEGQRGELCVKSAVNMARYHHREEDTKKALDAKGYFHSGDVAKIEGGFVYILDRLKDIIIQGGENVDCSEVEAALYGHPAVRECSVFGLPDERLGEVVATAVWLQDGATTAELAQHCAASLAKFKVPLAEHIFLLNAELPKVATGKIDKKGLRERYAAKIKSVLMSKL